MIGTNTGVAMNAFSFVYAHALAVFAFVVLLKTNDWRLPVILFVVVFIVVMQGVGTVIVKAIDDHAEKFPKPPTP